MWLVLLLAQTSPGAAPAEWLNFGTAGLVVVSFLLGWIWPRPAVDRLIRENERLREDVLAKVTATHDLVAQLLKERGREAP